jgi:hypothetical protein
MYVNRIILSFLLAFTCVFSVSDAANAQRRGGAIAAGIAAGAILGVLAAGAAGQRAAARPRYKTTRSAKRPRSQSPTSTGSIPQRSQQATPASGSDPFAGVAPTRRVKD